MTKIIISGGIFRGLFAILMSFVTSFSVSLVVVKLTKGVGDNFLELFLPSFFRSWPIVFILILIFVPLITKFLKFFFTIK